VNATRLAHRVEYAPRNSEEVRMARYEIRPLCSDGAQHCLAGRAEHLLLELLSAHEARCYTAEDLTRLGARAVSLDVRERLHGKPVYVSFDVDAIDPAFAPGTGTPVPGGLSSMEALQLLRGLAGTKIVGMDLVEVCPALDHADLTSLLGAHLLFEGLALLGVAR
jgi:arginase family enzyme